MAEQEQDRSEQATPFKLREARKRGQVAKSVDLNALFVLFGMLVAAQLFGEWMLQRIASISHGLLDRAGRVDFQSDHLLRWLGDVFTNMLFTLSPIFFVLIIVAVLGNLFQTGPIFSTFPLKPDFKRINPAEGFKRVFSMKTLFDAVKTCIKVVIFSVLSYMLIVDAIPGLFRLMNVDPVGHTPLFGELASSLLTKMLIAIAVIALLDLLYMRRDYFKRMRMSRRELKEEVKRREGDPLVRAKMRELQRELRRKTRGIGRTKDSDVVIVNPTHFAVALKYQRGKMQAPQILAKGTGKLARRIVVIAQRHHIPIIENKPLAQQLYWQGEIDAPIPEAAFEKVAHIMAWVMGLRSDLREGVLRSC